MYNPKIKNRKQSWICPKLPCISKGKKSIQQSCITPQHRGKKKNYALFLLQLTQSNYSWNYYRKTNIFKSNTKLSDMTWTSQFLFSASEVRIAKKQNSLYPFLFSGWKRETLDHRRVFFPSWWLWDDMRQFLHGPNNKEKNNTRLRKMHDQKKWRKLEVQWEEAHLS